MFTDRQKRLIEKAKALRHGYIIFASNVERQGWCSPKQEEALANMVATGEYRKKNWKMSPGHGGRRLDYKHDISDCEAMQSGDFF